MNEITLNTTRFQWEFSNKVVCEFATDNGDHNNVPTINAIISPQDYKVVS